MTSEFYAAVTVLRPKPHLRLVSVTLRNVNLDDRRTVEFLAAHHDDPLATEVAAAATEEIATFHTAAAEADGETYFGLLADDAVYIGTGASERSTVDEIKALTATIER